MHVFAVDIDHTTALVRLVAATTIQERRLFRSALAQVRLLFESGVYSVIYGMSFYGLNSLLRSFYVDLVWIFYMYIG